MNWWLSDFIPFKRQWEKNIQTFSLCNIFFPLQMIFQLALSEPLIVVVLINSFSEQNGKLLTKILLPYLCSELLCLKPTLAVLGSWILEWFAMQNYTLWKPSSYFNHHCIEKDLASFHHENLEGLAMGMQRWQFELFSHVWILYHVIVWSIIPKLKITHLFIWTMETFFSNMCRKLNI